MVRIFDVSMETGLSSDMVQLHGKLRARTYIVFGHLRTSLLDLHISAIPHGHHIAYQNWVENCTCSRLLSRAQRTAVHRSSDASINICSAAAFKLCTSTTTLMFVFPKDCKNAFMCASLACVFDVSERPQQQLYVSRFQETSQRTDVHETTKTKSYWIHVCCAATVSKRSR